jgi:hypothetical protein
MKVSIQRLEESTSPMSNGFSIVPNTPQNWTLAKVSDAPMDVRQQASMILANARNDANTSDIVKAAILPDSVQAAAFTNIDKV